MRRLLAGGRWASHDGTRAGHTAGTPMRTSTLLFVLSLVGVLACRRTPVQPPVPAVAALSPSPQVGVPAPAPRVPRTPLRAPAASTEWPGRTFPTAVAAVNDGAEGNAPDGRAQTVDLDLDGTADQWWASSCVASRHVATGWAAVHLGTPSQPEHSVCAATVDVAGHPLVAVTGDGHEVDEGRSSTWVEAQVTAFPGNDAQLSVWSQRVEANRGSAAGDFAFTPAGTDGLRIAASLGDAVPAGSPARFEQVLRWHPSAGAFRVDSCWDAPAATPSATLPDGEARCTVTARGAFHLRDVPFAGSDAAREVPAGTALQVLSVGTVRRGATTLHCVRVPDGSVGWTFLTAAERAPCDAALPLPR